MQSASLSHNATPLKPTALGNASAVSSAGASGFADTLLDIINPLQHIPIVSTLYQEATGDIPNAASKILGGGLFGGILGAASSLANVAVEVATGKDVGSNIVELAKSGQTSLHKEKTALQARALQPDDGSAAVIIAALGPSAPNPPTFFALKPSVPNVTAYSDPTLGLQNLDKAAQFKANLHKKFTDIVA